MPLMSIFANVFGQPVPTIPASELQEDLKEKANGRIFWMKGNQRNSVWGISLARH
jgi:hypothetical protein